MVKFLVFHIDLFSKYDKGMKTLNCEHKDDSSFKKTELAVACEISHLLTLYLSSPYPQDLANSTSKFSSIPRGQGRQTVANVSSSVLHNI